MSDFPEFDNLPDDPEVAFVRLYERYYEELQIKVEESSNDSRSHYAEFMNTTIGIAQGLGIDGFGEWNVPDEWDDIYPAFTGFDRAVKRFVMEIKVRKSRVTKVYSVALSNDEKERIHALVGQIRETIAKSDLDERKRNSLFTKLSAFETDVDRSRTRFDNAMLMSIEVVNLADKAANALNPINELLRRIMGIMGLAKDNEPEIQKLPAPTEQKRLEPPRKAIEGNSRELHDEIPF